MWCIAMASCQYSTYGAWVLWQKSIIQASCHEHFTFQKQHYVSLGWQSVSSVIFSANNCSYIQLSVSARLHYISSQHCPKLSQRQQEETDTHHAMYKTVCKFLISESGALSSCLRGLRNTYWCLTSKTSQTTVYIIHLHSAVSAAAHFVPDTYNILKQNSPFEAQCMMHDW